MTPANTQPATATAIAVAADLLRAGRLVAFPTETVYGLGADATSDSAVAAIFAAKGRPSFNPLIVHLADVESAMALTVWNDAAARLAAAFWPGPLTLVLPRAPNCPVSRLASAGLYTLAVRVPGHAIAHDLLSAVGLPIAAPSANKSERISPTRASHVAASLGTAVDLIVDGGPCPVGLESTVVAITDDTATLLRHGAVSLETIEAVIGPVSQAAGHSDSPRAPGMMQRHYAPRHALRLDATVAEPGEGFLAFGPNPIEGATMSLNLSLTGDLTEAAANLFAHLHVLDAADIHGIAVAAIPEKGLGRAINDRLRRAAQ